MENKFRFVSITRYAQLCGISREAVYKRLKSGKAKTLDLCEVQVIDLANSKGWKVLRFTVLNYQTVLQEVEKNIK